MEKYYDKVSIGSRIVNFIIKLTPYKKISDTEEAAKIFINKIIKVN